jgi:hypothetical protein
MKLYSEMYTCRRIETYDISKKYNMTQEYNTLRSVVDVLNTQATTHNRQVTDGIPQSK